MPSSSVVGKVKSNYILVFALAGDIQNLFILRVLTEGKLTHHVCVFRTYIYFH